MAIIVALAVLFGLGSGVYLFFRARSRGVRAVIALFWSSLLGIAVEKGPEIPVHLRPREVHGVPPAWAGATRMVEVDWEGVTELHVELEGGRLILLPGRGFISLIEEGPWHPGTFELATKKVQERLELVLLRKDRRGFPRAELVIGIPPSVERVEIRMRGYTVPQVTIYEVELEELVASRVRFESVGARVRRLRLEDTFEVLLMSTAADELHIEDGLLGVRIIDPQVPPEGASYVLDRDGDLYLLVTPPFNLALYVSPSAAAVYPERETYPSGFRAYLLGDPSAPPLTVKVVEGRLKVVANPSPVEGP